MMNLDGFRRWCWRHRDDVIGYSQDMDGCPLACYTTGKFQQPTKVAEYWVYAQDGTHHLTTLPRWARLVMREVDELGEFLPLTGEMVLRMTANL